MNAADRGLSATFNNDQLDYLAREHRPHGDNNYQARLGYLFSDAIAESAFNKLVLCAEIQPHDKSKATFPLNRLTKIETATIFCLFEKKGIRFAFTQFPDEDNNLSYHLILQDSDNPKRANFVNAIEARRDALISQIILDRFLTSAPQKVELQSTKKGIYIPVTDLTSPETMILEAHLKFSKIPYQHRSQSSHGSVFVIPYDHQDQVRELQQKFNQPTSSGMPDMKAVEPDLNPTAQPPKFEIIKTENKGLYIPIKRFSAEQINTLEDLLRSKNIPFKHRKSSEEIDGKPIGEVINVLLENWGDLEQIQIEIASKKDGQTEADYFMKLASSTSRAQLETPAYKPA